MSTNLSSSAVHTLTAMGMVSSVMVHFHLDFGGPFLKYTFLVMIDAHMKQLEAIPLPVATSQLTIQQLQIIFTCFGLPDTVVTGNRTCFLSSNLNSFYQKMASTTGKQHCTIQPAMA